ncbi:prolyl oligopeptidase family serine peptidase [Caulobacter sp.]|uniref:S9 family peptidase n=1 Tax=Caulobacter sp. TaxID=78 RepID=UPI0031D236AC
MRTFAALTLACALGFTPAHAERLFTVEDLLSLEDLGRVAFSPDERWLVLERQGPFKDAPSFDHEFLHPQSVMRLLVMDLKTGGPPKPLLPTDPQAGDTFGAFSPDGSRVLVFRLKDRRRELGVVTLATGAVRWSGLTVEPEYWTATARWRSDRELIVIDKPPEVASMLLGAGWQTQDRLTAAWADHRQGLYTGVVFGSGRYRDLTPSPPALNLVAFDVETGAVRPLANGAFADMLLSPDGATAAMIEDAELVQIDASVPKAFGGQPARWRRLALVDLATGKKTLPCPRCDLLHHAWAWSPDGKVLAAGARDEGRYGAPFRYWRFTLAGSAKALSPDLVVEEPMRELMVRPQGQVAWLGGHPVVLARPSSGSRTDWWSLGDKPVNLTASLDAPLGRAMAIAPDSVLVRTASGVFRVTSQGKPRLVAPSQARLSPGQVLVGTQPSSFLDARGSLSRRLGMDGASLPAAAVDPEQDVLAVAPRSGAVVAASKDLHGVTRVNLLRSTAPSVQVSAINEPLGEIAFAEAIAVPHTGIHGEALTSWLYLPRGHKASDDRGLVIVPYPGSRYDAPPFIYKPGALHFETSVQLMVAKGYAVLAPSLPMAMDEPPAPRLAEAMLLAVDAARRQQPGLSASKLAIWGNSYGGYGALLAGSESARFKALIASAPLTDLFGVHNTQRLNTLAIPEITINVGTWAAFTEAGQGRMGAKPQDAPDLYIANSPRFQAGKISAPVLLLFGDLDFGIHQAQGMFSALFREGKDAQLVVYRGEQHVPINPGNVRDLYRRAFAFLEDAFGGPETVAGARPSAP